LYIISQQLIDFHSQLWGPETC